MAPKTRVRTQLFAKYFNSLNFPILISTNHMLIFDNFWRILPIPTSKPSLKTNLSVKFEKKLVKIHA